MNTRQLYYLLRIAEAGNLSHAAQTLGLSQPALSKVLSEWESLCGSPLFLRSRRHLSPTALGQALIESAEKIVDEQNRMVLTMRRVSGHDRQNIRICTAPNRGAIIYSRIYNQFSRRYPEISLHLTELYAQEQPGAICRGQVDLALGAGTNSETVTDIPIAREELLVSLPASHPMAGQKTVRLSDLRDIPFVLQGKRHSIRAIADRLFHEAGFEPIISFESNDVILLDSMMHQAVGAGLVSKAHVFPCKELAYLSLDPPVYQSLHVRYPLGHSLTEPERYLAGLLIRERLNDPRYEAIHSPEADALFSMVEDAEEHYPVLSTKSGNAGVIQQSTQMLGLDTQVLRYLIAIVEEQSLTRAAERFYLAQPALSRHLRNMETLLGLPLFIRENNRLHPTNAGKVFVNNARNILRMTSELEHFINTYQAGHGGKLFIHCDPTFFPLLHDKVEVQFASLYPDISLKIVESNTGDAEEALLNASTDFGLYLTRFPHHPMLSCSILSLTELVYCTDPSRPLPGVLGGDALPGTLSGRELMLAPSGTTLRAEQDRLIPQLYTDQARVVCQAEFPLLQRLVSIGVADTILPLHMLKKSERSHCFSFQPPRSYYLVLAHNPSRTLSPPEQALYRLIKDAFDSFFLLQE